MPILDRLRAASRAGQPKDSVHVGGRLTDSAIGAIYIAKSYAKSSPNGGQNGGVSGPTMRILKSIDLNEQNVYAVVQGHKTTVRGLPEEKALYLSNSYSDAKLWRSTWCTAEGPQGDDEAAAERTAVAKVCWTEGPLDRDLAKRVLRCNEYLTEAMVGLIVSEHVPVPHFIKTHDAWISSDTEQGPTGFILQDYGGSPLLKACVDLSLAEFQSVILQTLIALAVAQQCVALKHHDMHLDNVFVYRIKSPVEGSSADAGSDSAVDSSIGRPTGPPGDYWAYTLKTSAGPKTFYVRNKGLLAKIGDWGLASATEPTSATRVERVDYPLLDATETEWGQWCGALSGQESYDAVTLLSKMFLEDEVSMMSPAQVEWARKAYKAIVAVQPKIACSTIGRPFRGREGTLSASDILALPFFAEALKKPEAPDAAIGVVYSGRP